MTEKILYWVPRILTIFAILFMLMFSFDVFEGNEPFSRKLLGLLIHNIPVLILAGLLIIAWVWELPGGILFIAAFITGSIFFESFSGNPGSLVVIVPFLISGILFILHHLLFGRYADDKKSEK
jgi:hypothetical protein